MRLLDSASPMQLVGLAATGCAFVLTGYIAVDQLHHLPRGLGIACFALLDAIGIGLGLIAQSRLTQGFENGQWNEQRMAPVRALIKHPAYRRVELLLALFVLAIFVGHFVFRALHVDLATVYWPAFWILMTFGQIRAAAKPRTKSAPSDGWLNAAPIRSEHWGERTTVE